MFSDTEILRYYRNNHFNAAATARELGISERGLRRRISKLRKLGAIPASALSASALPAGAIPSSRSTPRNLGVDVEEILSGGWQTSRPSRAPIFTPSSAPTEQQYTRILCVGDAHVEQDQDLSRFSALERLISRQETHLDYVVLMGDFLSLNSLSFWDLDKRRKMEGRRYWSEIQSGNEALDRLQGVRSHPQWIYLMGNHEDRLTRYLDKNPELEGGFDVTKNLRLTERGFRVIEYGECFRINDILFTHIPFAKNGKPISGINLTSKALNMTTLSIVYGHTHRLEMENRHRYGSPHLQQALNVGCFFPGQQDYVKHAATDDWKGICILKNYDFMRFDIETISLSRLINHVTDT